MGRVTQRSANVRTDWSLWARSASGADGTAEQHLEPAKNRPADLLQLAEALRPVATELGGTHALQDLAIAV
jgi:hypothetical protein